MTEKTLHACLAYAWDSIWIELHTDFEFTKRIKYTKEHGDFSSMYLEICWGEEERRWYSFWKITPIVSTKWIHSDYFEYKYPHTEAYETVIEECS